ncbi:hypothetical protein GTP44_22515 [Duganella sp. FT50W]|uniref:Uncharacterized protein n=1 Tax=Duganella lactea TaxID=2692173 RepID=A0A6L8MRN9_9BURK|nr:hypothetical protein [Duganella lactea]MYM84707.1 hypothetical protein [Duganella lactea]
MHGDARYGQPEEDLLWSFGLLTFVVAQQINYHHYQRMYDTGDAFAYLRR